MNDGSYMTVTLVEGGGFNMRPYTPSQALQVSVGSSKSDPRLLTPMDELGDELVKELKINAMAILKKVSLNPAVLWSFNYVTNMIDPDTKQP